jgi:hypothetical protein
MTVASPSPTPVVTVRQRASGCSMASTPNAPPMATAASVSDGQCRRPYTRAAATIESATASSSQPRQRMRTGQPPHDSVSAASPASTVLPT